jgi:hypothetical protein
LNIEEGILQAEELEGFGRHIGGVVGGDDPRSKMKKQRKNFRESRVRGQVEKHLVEQH